MEVFTLWLVQQRFPRLEGLALERVSQINSLERLTHVNMQLSLARDEQEVEAQLLALTPPA